MSRKLRLGDPPRLDPATPEHGCAISSCSAKPAGGALVCPDHGAELRQLYAQRLARPVPAAVFSHAEAEATEAAS